MSRPYYTMVVKYGDTWGPEFGDYDRQVVLDQIIDEYPDATPNEARMIVSKDDQRSIDATIAFLNMTGRHRER